MSTKRQKILIIKLGYSETLIPEIGHRCSLGDVFRTTAVLHLFKNRHVTWLTDRSAVPLLKDNPYIDRILVFDATSVMQLERERFDKVINLEKVPGICAMGDRIEAWSHYGFRFDQVTGKAEAHEHAYEALAIATMEDAKKLNNKPWVEILYSMLGAEWKGESYILGYQPKSEIEYDLGFNMHVGSLFPVKAWPHAYWKELEERVRGGYRFSYQQHLNDLTGYMNWINSCRLIITNDSLGLHLGIAMGKKVIGLFGPTPAYEQSPHPNLHILFPDIERECMPCLKVECEREDACMKYIAPDKVVAGIRSIFETEP